MPREQFLLTVTASFEAAHRIRLSGSVCEKLHGHRWTIEAVFTGSVGEQGIVRDFTELDRELQARVISVLDHSDLNERFPQPTSELLCRWIWEQLAPMGIAEIRLWETPFYSVIYRGKR
ncbi:MAG: 6-carboxytetrahydropterin synthase [Candidatus Aureabacteria bacterium]|nr:6-carboxytetrahydropterin synthase [Candidatus Auribacterota bacterium]